jgi:hypothetical protein
MLLWDILSFGRNFRGNRVYRLRRLRRAKTLDANDRIVRAAYGSRGLRRSSGHFSFGRSI